MIISLPTPFQFQRLYNTWEGSVVISLAASFHIIIDNKLQLLPVLYQVAIIRATSCGCHGNPPVRSGSGVCQGSWLVTGSILYDCSQFADMEISSVNSSCLLQFLHFPSAFNTWEDDGSYKSSPSPHEAILVLASCHRTLCYWNNAVSGSKPSFHSHSLADETKWHRVLSEGGF